MPDSKPSYEKDLVNILAHDLRTPISSAMNFVELARQFGPLNDKQEEYIQKGLNALNRMEDIVNDVMELRRLDRDESLRTELCNLRLHIGEAISFLEGAANANDITISAEVPQDLPEVEADPNLIRQMLNNLLGNAIKYNREGGTVTVKAVYEDDTEAVRIDIVDTGYGVDEYALEEIFEPFVRARNHSGKRVAGTGLGLAIVKLIVEKHGGKIKAESVVQEGSRFVVRLPKESSKEV